MTVSGKGFSEATRDWDGARLAAFLRDAADILVRDASAESLDQSAAIFSEAMTVLEPVAFELHTTPVGAILAAIRELARYSPRRLLDAYTVLVRGGVEGVTHEQLNRALCLLAEIEFPAGEGLAFAALDWVASDPSDTGSSIAETAIYLAGFAGGGVSVQALTDRLKLRRLYSGLAAEAAVRILATVEPRFLPDALAQYEDALVNGLSHVADARWLLEDVIARAGERVLTNALLQLAPASHVTLYRATFNFEAPGAAIFQLGTGLPPLPEPTVVSAKQDPLRGEHLIARRGMAVIDLTDTRKRLFGPARLYEWHDSFFRALGRVLPASRPVEAQAADDADEEEASAFTLRFQTRMQRSRPRPEGRWVRSD